MTKTCPACGGDPTLCDYCPVPGTLARSIGETPQPLVVGNVRAAAGPPPPWTAHQGRRRMAEGYIDEALSASGYNASMAEKAFLIELIARVI